MRDLPRQQQESGVFGAPRLGVDPHIDSLVILKLGGAQGTRN